MSAKWERQGDLFSVPRARWSNPDTSRAAAESISLDRVTETQARILSVLRINGPLSDEQLVERFHHSWPDSASDQGIRSRRGELVRKGRVVDSGRRGTTRYGRSCVIWRVS